MPRMYPEMGHQAPLFVEAPALRKVAAAASFSLMKSLCVSFALMERP